VTGARHHLAVQRSSSFTRLFASAALAVGALVAGHTPATAAEEQPARDAVAQAGALLARAVPHVERVCATEFPAPPRVMLVTARKAAALFRSDLRPEIERRYADASESQRRTLLELSASSSVASCLARYSFGAKAIVIVRESFERQRAAAGFGAEDAEDLLLAVLAHEAVHALDDARFDLGALYSGAASAEALRARAMLVEGRAVHFGRIAAKAAGASERACALLPGGPEPTDVRQWTLRLTYATGAEFVGRLVERGGIELADRALKEPPESTHLIFHDDLWPASATDDRPAARLRRAGLATNATTLSELQLRARYCALHGPDRAQRVFAGFRGGAQALVDATNVSVLAFADRESAAAYVEIARSEAPTRYRGCAHRRADGSFEFVTCGHRRVATGREPRRESATTPGRGWPGAAGNGDRASPRAVPHVRR